MKPNWRCVGSVFASGLWINASEFFRNEVLVKGRWLDHYRTLGIVFPSAPVNGAVWMLWGFSFAALVCALTRKFGLMGGTFAAWFAGFALIWIVLWNLSVLPLGILPFAVPLSLFETFVAALICKTATGA